MTDVIIDAEMMDSMDDYTLFDEVMEEAVIIANQELISETLDTNKLILDEGSSHDGISIPLTSDFTDQLHGEVLPMAQSEPSSGLRSSVLRETMRTPKTGIQSLFFQDLATPISSSQYGSKFNIPGQSTAVSLWREKFANSDNLPPPPVFTLEDRRAFSTTKTKSEASTSYVLMGSGSAELDDRVGKDSIPVGNFIEHKWITVYGFSPIETNSVLREFEKYGIIVKHILGPRDSNWMHILYKNRADAQKALNKNGMKINGVIMIGVKPVDTTHTQALNDKLNKQEFIPRPHARSSKSYSSNRGSVATPTRSIVSRIWDFILGV